MLSLELELIAILVLAAVVGILMGRSLCKNGENEEREKKDKVIHLYKALKNEFEITQGKIKEQKGVVKGLEDGMAQAEQEIDNIQTRLHSSDAQRIHLLEELKVLEKYKSRFESLDREFKLQSKIVEELKNEKIVNQKEISDFEILTNGLNKNIVNLKEKQGKLDDTILKLKERIDFKDIEHERLLNSSYEKYQSQLQVKLDAYEKLKEESILKYRDMIKVKDESYDELKVLFDSLKREYDEFKLKHTLDSDRLDSLEYEHQKIYLTLDTVILERDDLVARLRAISSVVGAVGIEGASSDKSQQLLENR